MLSILSCYSYIFCIRVILRTNLCRNLDCSLVIASLLMGLNGSEMKLFFHPLADTQVLASQEVDERLPPLASHLLLLNAVS